jgi:subtilisin-like proprotein convertase family protein
VTVQTFLSHERPEDLDLVLKLPNGQLLPLTTDNGGAAANVFLGTTWSNRANPGGQVPYGTNAGLATDHPYAPGVRVPLLAPEGSLLPPYDAFPERANGVWELRVTDDTPGAGGTLSEWRLTVRTTTARVQIYSNFASNQPTSISSGPPNVVESDIVVPAGAAAGVLQRLDVRTQLRHTAPGDLDITLRSPAGTVVTLTTDNAGSSDDAFNGTGWGGASSAGSPSVSDYVFTSGVPAANLLPEEPLAAFQGEDPTGTWTLRVSDDTTGDGGTLDSWELTLATLPECASKGDLDGSVGFTGGDDDLVFRSASTGQHMLWRMSAANRIAEQPLTFSVQPPPTRQVVGMDQFDLDPATSGRQPGLVVHDASSGQVEFWGMEGANRVRGPFPLTGAAPLPLNWRLSATGDFNHDGSADLLWRNVTSQKLVIWTLGQLGAPVYEKTGAIVPSPDQAVHANWEVVAALDFDGDNNRDLLWYNATSGKIVVWFMDAQVRRTLGTFTDPPNAGDANWRVVAAGDYGPPDGGDKKPDIVWRNATSGRLVIWFMDGASNPPTRLSGTFTTPDSPADALDWTVVAPR